jgi:hypothetical protein
MTGTVVSIYKRPQDGRGYHLRLRNYLDGKILAKKDPWTRSTTYNGENMAPIMIQGFQVVPVCQGAMMLFDASFLDVRFPSYRQKHR